VTTAGRLRFVHLLKAHGTSHQQNFWLKKNAGKIVFDFTHTAGKRAAWTSEVAFWMFFAACSQPASGAEIVDAANHAM
jgi:hypothetical protein